MSEIGEKIKPMVEVCMFGKLEISTKEIGLTF